MLILAGIDSALSASGPGTSLQSAGLLAPHLIPGYTHYMIAISEKEGHRQPSVRTVRSYRHPDRPNAVEAPMSSFRMEPRITATKSKIKFGTGPQG